MSTRRRLHHDESGAVAVIAGVSLTTLLLFSAYVIDLSFLRADRIASQSVADMAAAAASVDYRPGMAGSAQDACLEALDFATTNLGNVSATPVRSCAVAFPSSFDAACDPDFPETAEYTSGPYTIQITMPVPDDDVRMAEHDNPDAEFDGLPCQRVGVEVHRTRDFILGPVAGYFSSSTQRGAVARSWIDGKDGDYASLIVLERSGCASLAATGNSNAQIRVENLTRIEDGEEVTYPGIITSDTGSASCGANKPVIYVSGNASIFAEGTLYSHALNQGDPQAQVYDDSYVTDETGQLWQRPTAGPQITRSPVDHLINCLPDYAPFSSQRWSPSHSSSIGTIDGCELGNGAYVKALADNLLPVGTPSQNPADAGTVDGLRAAGWSVFPEDFAGQSCNSASGNYGPDDDFGPGTDGQRFYVNCGQNSNVFTPSGITFSGVHTIVHRNGITMSNAGHVYTIQGRDADGTNVFFQRGAIDRSGGSMLWTGVFVYIHDEFITASGSGAVTWRAPLGPTATGCPGPAVSGVPPAACFSPVALWSNVRTNNVNANNQKNFMGGQSALDLAGSFFTPNSTFNLSGQAPYTLTDAQFFSSRLETSGQAALTMTPNPDTTIEIPIRSRNLIR